MLLARANTLREAGGLYIFRAVRGELGELGEIGFSVQSAEAQNFMESGPAPADV